MTDEVELQDTPAPIESVEPDAVAEATDAKQEESSPSVEDQSKDKKKPWFTERIDDLTANWRSTERERDYWREQALNAKTEEVKPEPTHTVDQKPTVEKYDSYDDYLEALTDWKYEQRVTADRQAQEAQRKQQEKAQVAQTFNQRSQTVRETHPDFDQVVNNPTLPISEAMAEAAFASEKGPEILYFLGTNPGEAQRIYSLPPFSQALELGKIEAQLARPPKNQTNAPEPIQPVSGASGKQTVDPASMSMKDYVQWRMKQMQR